MKEEIQSGVEAANSHAADYQRCVYSFMYHYIIFKLIKYFVCSENRTSETPVFSLSLFYVFIYSVLQLSLCEKNNEMCVCVCVSQCFGQWRGLMVPSEKV